MHRVAALQDDTPAVGECWREISEVKETELQANETSEEQKHHFLEKQENKC